MKAIKEPQENKSIRTIELENLFEDNGIEADVEVSEGYISINNMSNDCYDELINQGIYEDIFEIFDIIEIDNKKTKNMLEIWYEENEDTNEDQQQKVKDDKEEQRYQEYRDSKLN